jgi:Kef-type K+ transport system membrane component KefB
VSTTNDLGLLALIFAAALLGPALTLATRGALPAVVGELVAGVILGRTALNIVNPAKGDFALLYDLGFLTLMLSVGMNVPLHDPRIRGAIGKGAAAAAGVVPLALASGFVAHLAGGGPALVYAVVIGSSSAAIALPVIDETHLTGSAVLTAMAWITIADIVSTLAIPLAIDPSRSGHSALGALIVAALVALVFVVVQWLGSEPWVQSVRKEGKRRGWAIDLRLALIVLVGLAYIALKVGASLLVAGFGVGLVIAARGGPKRLSNEVLGLGQAFLVPLFFVLLGAHIDLRALTSSHRAILLAVALAVLAIAVHLTVTFLIRAPRAVGLLATAQVGVPAAVIALGLPAHAITDAQAAAIFCAALVSIAATAAGAAILRRAAGGSGGEAHRPAGRPG